MLNNLDLSCTVTVPSCTGIIATTGVGKTRQIRVTIDALLKSSNSAVVIFVPNIKLGTEMLVELKASFHNHTVRQYLGITQLNPSSPSQKMCIRKGDVDKLTKLGVSIDQLCGDKKGYCTHHAVISSSPCGYSVQSQQKADIWILSHASLFIKKPAFIGEPALKVIDESFHASAKVKEKVGAVTLELGDLVNPAMYTSGSYLLTIANQVSALIAQNPDGYLNMMSLSGYIDNQLRASLDTICRTAVSVSFRSTAADIQLAIDSFKGSRAHALILFWSLLYHSSEYEYGTSSFIQKVTKGKNGNTKATLEMCFIRPIHPSWQSPTALLDATMPIEINKIFFPNLKTKEVHASARHVAYTQITDSLLSKTQFHRTPATYDKVLEILEFKCGQIPDSHPVKVLLVCSKTQEQEFIARGLPEKVETLHYGKVTGSNRYSMVPCIVVAGRIEMPVAVAERLAAMLSAKELRPSLPNYQKQNVLVKGESVSAYYHPDSLVESLRRSMNESQLLQAIGRGRAVRRTHENPLDVLILTSVPLNLEPELLTLTDWKNVQATTLEMILSMDGIVPLGTGELQRRYPGTFSSKKKARIAVEHFKQRYLIGTTKNKVGALLSIINIYREKGTYHTKVWALILYTPDLKNAKPTLAAVQKEEGKSIQETLSQLTTTKPLKKKGKKQRTAILKKVNSMVRTIRTVPGTVDPLSLPIQDTSYSIVGIFTGDGFELPGNLQGIQYYDPKEKGWTQSLCADTTAECGAVNGRVYFQLKNRKGGSG
jgi:hypothetical protein